MDSGVRDCAGICVIYLSGLPSNPIVDNMLRGLPSPALIFGPKRRNCIQGAPIATEAGLVLGLLPREL